MNLIISILTLVFLHFHLQNEKIIKIMPVGDSITAGEHYGYPALSERTGYRKDLYYMLTSSGYLVDFVGSQNHGIRDENEPNWYDWNCEAYPGWQIKEITKNLKESLENYHPDILLVHVGTNGEDWDKKPGHVMEMLDMINDYSVKFNDSITVFLCKIINRFEGAHELTTQFNDKVADLLAARKGDKIKIILIDMEKGAGLDYSDNPPDSSSAFKYEGGDMWGTKYPGVDYDLFHPNDKGNKKIAKKFYLEMIKAFENMK